MPAYSSIWICRPPDRYWLNMEITMCLGIVISWLSQLAGCFWPRNSWHLLWFGTYRGSLLQPVASCGGLWRASAVPFQTSPLTDNLKAAASAADPFMYGFIKIYLDLYLFCMDLYEFMFILHGFMLILHGFICLQWLAFVCFGTELFYLQVATSVAKF